MLVLCFEEIPPSAEEAGRPPKAGAAFQKWVQRAAWSRAQRALSSTQHRWDIGREDAGVGVTRNWEPGRG